MAAQRQLKKRQSWKVLRAVAQDPQARLRAIAAFEITGRTILAVVTDLEQAGYLRRRRGGRRNQASRMPRAFRICVRAHSNS
ncbi:hypothetical protein E5082_26640 [Streptomyces griseoluteus]|uniref:MarR family transcriptional regulator n=1 Tax=Streptomyces griseoluteus TaxID=29306 RepID=A0A4Z1D4I6_STRGP|nr:hypothetical protein [Streptomyces griseoluteus]TGN76906.1 hypothetical protein E5082_26640 [Streptomyces griseoluteus]